MLPSHGGRIYCLSMSSLIRTPQILVHAKRYQDVEGVLQAGIDVWTTLNIQHLESLTDVVEKITGITVRETVPDRVLERADEIVVVDLPPEDLIQRTQGGKSLPPGKRPARD